MRIATLLTASFLLAPIAAQSAREQPPAELAFSQKQRQELREIIREEIRAAMADLHKSGATVATSKVATGEQNGMKTIKLDGSLFGVAHVGEIRGADFVELTDITNKPTATKKAAKGGQQVIYFSELGKDGVVRSVKGDAVEGTVVDLTDVTAEKRGIKLVDVLGHPGAALAAPKSGEGISLRFDAKAAECPVLAEQIVEVGECCETEGAAGGCCEVEVVVETKKSAKKAKKDVKEKGSKKSKKSKKDESNDEAAEAIDLSLQKIR